MAGTFWKWDCEPVDSGPAVPDLTLQEKHAKYWQLIIKSKTNKQTKKQTPKNYQGKNQVKTKKNKNKSVFNS